MNMRDFLVKQRKELGISQQEAAFRCGVSISLISSIEQKYGSELKLSIARKIVEGLGFDIQVKVTPTGAGWNGKKALIIDA